MYLFDQLSKTQHKTLSYFDLSEADLAKSYAPGKWNVRQLLHHIVDAETVLYDRVRRVISKPGQVIQAFDQDAWAAGLAYEHKSLATNKAIYVAIRAGVMELAKKYYESHGTNGFTHSETGKRTLKEEFDKIAWHNAHHLDQIAQALEK